MRSIGISGLALLTMISTAAAQDSRKEAMEEIARALSDIEEIMPDQSEAMTYSTDPGVIQQRVDAVTRRIEDLRKYLSDHGYAVRVSGFSLGIPFGASISFEFQD